MTASVFLSAARVASWQDHALGAVAYTPASTYYCERFTTCPDNAGAGGAIDTNFTPVAVTNNTTFWTNAASGVKVNAGTILWNANAGTQASHAGWGIYDHATLRTGAHLVAVVRFASVELINTGATPAVAPGDFSLALKLTGAAVFPGTYLANKMLDHEFGNAAFTPAATLTLRGYSVNPIAAGTGGTEATYTGYAAQTYNNDTTTWTSSVALAKKNNIGLVLPQSTSTQTLTGMALWDGSNLYCVAVGSWAVTSGHGPFIPAGSFNWVWSAA